MKRRILAITAALLLFGGIVSADGLNGSYNGNPIVLVKSSGQTVSGDVPAQLQGDNTMIPLGLLRRLGVTVDWDQRSYTADVKLPKQHANVLSQAELDSLSRNVGIVSEYDANGNYIGQGTGFVVGTGVFVTNHHVASYGNSIKVTVNGSNYASPKLLFDDPGHDLYGVKINESSTLRTSDIPEVNSKVYTIGYSKGTFSIGTGSVIAVNSTKNGTAIETTAKIEGGHSGGVLLNEFGELIGVTTFSYDDTHTSGAIAVKYVIDELSKLK